MKASFGIAVCAAFLATLFALDSHAGGQTADVSITITDGTNFSVAGETTVYTIVASNAGPGDAANNAVAVSFPLEATCSWVCLSSAGSSCTVVGSGDIIDVVDLLAAGSATYTANCDVDVNATGPLVVTASIGTDAGVTDPDLGNNDAADTNSVLPAALEVPTLAIWSLLALALMIGMVGLVQMVRGRA